MSDVGRIDGKTQLVALIGTPVGHSMSPAMHNLSFEKLGLNYSFMAFDIGHEKLEEAIAALRVMDAKGFSVTMPLKIDVKNYLDGLSEGAKFSGAVNAVVNKDNQLIGYNTDGMGFVRNLKDHGVELKGKKMTLIGSGGAATPIAVQSVLDGISEISIFARDDSFFPQAVENARTINEDMKYIGVKANVFPLEDTDKLREEIASSDILANATRVGMKPLDNLSVVPDVSMLRPGLVVVDTVYNPRKTILLEQAESVGAKTVGGLGMLLWQGALAFELWTGREMPIDLVEQTLFGEPVGAK